jgi:hypothetical protein
MPTSGAKCRQQAKKIKEALSVKEGKNNGRILVISEAETEKIHEDAERLLSASWKLLRDANLFFTQIEKAGRHSKLRTASWALLRAANTLFSKAEALHELVEQELSGEGDA